MGTYRKAGFQATPVAFLGAWASKSSRWAEHLIKSKCGILASSKLNNSDDDVDDDVDNNNNNT